MADRYWVGGTGTWDTTSTTNWSTASGGAGGASVPTFADNVFFDQAETYTVTLTGELACLDITVSAGTVTFDPVSNPTLTVSGSMTLIASTTVNQLANSLVFNSSVAGNTINTGGANFGVSFGVKFNGTSDNASWSLTGSLTTGISSSIVLQRGTLNTNNYNVTCFSFTTTGNALKTLNLGSSTITTLTPGASFSCVGSNQIINGGTSTINCGGSFAAASAGGSSLTGMTGAANLVFTGSVTSRTIQGVNTFNNVTVPATTIAGLSTIFISDNQTINGTLSVTGTAGNKRVWFRSNSTAGIAQTLYINAVSSLADVDFRDIFVTGPAAPISGTRIGDLRGNSGIVFSTPKTVYWSGSGGAGGNWAGNNWSDTLGGGTSIDNFPLAQDTAVISNTGLTSGQTINFDSLFHIGTIDMSSRTDSMTLNLSTSYTVYGDWKNGSGVTLSNTNTLTFSGRKTQTITSAGKTFSCSIVIDSFGGTVELADNFDNGIISNLIITNGTFNSKNFNINTGSLQSANLNVRSIILGSSTVTCNIGSGINFENSKNLDFQAGTSTINIQSGGTVYFNANPGLTFNNVNFNGNNGILASISGSNTFNNLTFADQVIPPGLIQFNANQTITGTLTFTGTTAVRRMLISSNTLGTPCTLTVGTLVANNMDFRDIIIAGNAANTAPTLAGDCGGNSGIVFPAPKTVYWNLAGTQNWSATGWASSSGDTPDINLFPLAQDTAIFDDVGSAGTVIFNGDWNIGTLDASLRTLAMTLGTGTSSYPKIYGNWKFGTGVTSSTSGSGNYTFAKNGTQTITSNGVTFGRSIIIGGPSNTNYVQLADALSLSNSSASSLVLNSGTFDAGTNNVTVFSFSTIVVTLRTLKMGSGTWTLTGTGTVWSGSANNINFYKGTANILLSNTSTSDRTFSGAGLSYNKLTIGGITGTSTTFLISSNQFTELASIKTVAHTISFGATSQTFGKWTVTGTPGNVVTLSGTANGNVIAGACTSGIDYLEMGSIGFAATSPGEFYAGANSTGTASAPVYRTAKPADSVRYWVGGTGSWSDTNRWSTSSGGAGGASVPRSHDDVVFDSSSNATDYTVTVDAVTGGIRMKALTIAGPASGIMTLAGSVAMEGIHGNVTLPATGLTRTYSAAITLSGSTTGKTITTNGVTIANQLRFNGVGSEWSLGSSLTSTSSIDATNGSLDLVTYNLTSRGISSNSTNKRTIKLGTGTHTFSENPIVFGTSETQRADLIFDAGTSQINCTKGGLTFDGNNQTFYNVSFAATTGYSTITISGANTFNNLTFNSLLASAYGRPVIFNANQTITGALTVLASISPGGRNIFQSNTIGTTITLTCGAVVMSDADFRDITIAGTAAPASGTRIGDCKGNSGIVFTPATTRYWNFPTGTDWQYGWANSPGGTASSDNFPLAQDTCIIENTGLNSSASITMGGVANYPVGTIDMSARTLPMTIGTNVSSFLMLGNWINGTGTTTYGTGRITFAGRNSQTITSAGKTFTQPITIHSPGGSVTLLDSYTYNSGTTNDNPRLSAGTFNANGYNVTSAQTGTFIGFNASGSDERTLAMGSGTWTFAGGGTQFTISGSNITITGTATVKFTSAGVKSFAGGGFDYSGITLEQAGAGTLTITGDTTFKSITNSYNTTGPTTINFGNTTQRVYKMDLLLSSPTNKLTLSGTNSSNPATLIYLGKKQAMEIDSLNIVAIRFYPLINSWYVGKNSTSNGSLGAIFNSSARPDNSKFLLVL